MTSAITEAAVEYAKRGLFVVPVIDKVPSGGKQWPKLATNDPEAARLIFTSRAKRCRGIAWAEKRCHRRRV